MKLVFDLGGVVLNWRPYQLLQEVWPQRIADEQTAQLWASQIFESFNPNSDWAQFDLGLIDPEALAVKIANRVGVTQEEMQALIESIPNHLSPLPGTVQLLADLKAAGHPLYFLSNMPATYANFLEEAHDFFGYFLEGIFSARIQQIKPSPQIFLTANQQFQVSGKDTIFIDDVQHNIDAAEAHGWTGIRFDNPQQVRQQLIQLKLLSA